MKKPSKIIQFSKEKKYSIPSNLGGSFTIKFIKYDNGYYYFQILNKDFESEIKYTQLTINEVKEINN